MPKPLDPDDLKKQIASTRAHLAWLESLLGEKEETAAAPKPAEAADSVSKPVAEEPTVEAPVEQEAPAQASEPSESLAKPEEPKPAKPEVPEISEEDMRRMAEGDVSVSAQVAQVRNGCIGLAVFGIIVIAVIYWVWSVKQDEKRAEEDATSSSALEYRVDPDQWS
ncbi:MAG: hypothetical protein ACPGN3_07790 [Opitutales bacterium]